MTFDLLPENLPMDEDEITVSQLEQVVSDSTSKAFTRMMDKRGFVVIFRSGKLIKKFSNGREELIRTA